MIIAIDGPAASGKGTLARRLASHFGLAYLDSGSLYRAVAVTVLAAGDDPADPHVAARAAQSIDPAAMDPASLRTAEVSRAASILSAIPEVRAALLEFQREFARRGAVIDGRDIGTVVMPDADVKLYVSASIEERARRRTEELRQSGDTRDEAAIRADLAERDRRDAERALAPMRPADDALLLDTTDLDIEAAFQTALRLIESRLDTAARARP